MPIRESLFIRLKRRLAMKKQSTSGITLMLAGSLALAGRPRARRQRTAVINELRAVYAKRNIDPQARLGRVRPSVAGAEDFSGYGRGLSEKMWSFWGLSIGRLGDWIRN